MGTKPKAKTKGAAETPLMQKYQNFIEADKARLKLLSKAEKLTPEMKANHKIIVEGVERLIRYNEHRIARGLKPL